MTKLPIERGVQET